MGATADFEQGMLDLHQDAAKQIFTDNGIDFNTDASAIEALDNLETFATALTDAFKAAFSLLLVSPIPPSPLAAATGFPPNNVNTTLSSTGKAAFATALADAHLTSPTDIDIETRIRDYCDGLADVIDTYIGGFRIPDNIILSGVGVPSVALPAVDTGGVLLATPLLTPLYTPAPTIAVDIIAAITAYIPTIQMAAGEGVSVVAGISNGDVPFPGPLPFAPD